METAALTVLVVAEATLLLALVVFCAVSVRERQPRASRLALFLSLVVVDSLAVNAVLPDIAVVPLAGAMLTGIGLFALSCLLPLGKRPSPGGDPTQRVDERDIMFARARLKPGTEEYQAYYSMRPGNRQGDDEMRALPGLLSPSASLADPARFARAEEYFATTEALHSKVDGEVASGRTELLPEQASARLTAMAIELGAVDSGTAELLPYHIYTHVGRGSGGYGTPIKLPHTFALAFTVEMDHGAMRHAPAAPAVVESGRQYVRAAEIAIAIADHICSLGYSARAHIDGNYRVIAPLVARDAGLGEIGRMGLLMTPRLGPRVRLGVVTTELPLEIAGRKDDLSVLDFCSSCRKCAEVCPAAAIPHGQRTKTGGTGLRWKIDDEACFRLWCTIGTDCGRCMAVCPYSHPDSPIHNIARWIAGRCTVGRRVLLTLDDIFYGPKPKPLPASEVDTNSLTSQNHGETKT